jgi:hypothetical protein
MITKPDFSIVAEYYRQYINRVSSDNLLLELENQKNEIILLLKSIPETLGSYRYEPGKWSVKELICHLLDTERVFCFRCLSFARDHKGELPGFDHDNFVRRSMSDYRTMESIVDEFETVRNSTISLFKTFSPEMLNRMGVANGQRIDSRTYGYVIVGHCDHHLSILSSRYLGQIGS